MASPANVNAKPRLPKESNIPAEVAPNAIRTPISLVRSVTGVSTRAKADSPSVQLLAPVFTRAAQTLKKIRHEYSLRNELDAAWAVQKNRRHNRSVNRNGPGYRKWQNM